MDFGFVMLHFLTHLAVNAKCCLNSNELLHVLYFNSKKFFTLIQYSDKIEKQEKYK